MSRIYNGKVEVTLPLGSQYQTGYYLQHPGVFDRLKQILDQWHEAQRADYNKNNNWTGTWFDEREEKHAHVGDKYIRLDVGGSGAWMLEAETGIIYNIKGYGKVDKKKIAGDINDPEFDGAVLFRDRFRYGRFDNRKVAA
jgi:hypothetical protein